MNDLHAPSNRPSSGPLEAAPGPRPAGSPSTTPRAARAAAGTTGRAVLVLSTDVVVASLLGVLLETAGYEPVYARVGEQPLVAFGRLHPDAVIVDCDRSDACTPGFYTYLREHRTGALVFSPGRAAYEVREIAQQFGLGWFSLPIDRVALAHGVADAIAAARRE